MSEPKLAEVVSIYETNSRDIPAMLRKMADDIEAGVYGDVGEAAFVLCGTTVEVFGWGAEQDGSIRAVESHGR